MSAHNSFEFFVFTLGMMLFVPLFFWLGIRHSIRSLKLPQAKQKQILSVSALILFGWFFFSIAIALLDFYHVSQNILSPLVPIAFILPVAIGASWLQSSKTLQKILEAFPQHWLILLQIFRILGIVFIMLYLQGLLPALFAIPSGLGDMLIGGFAPIVAYWYWKKKNHYEHIVKIWNYLGIIDLLIAIGVGIILAIQVPIGVSLTTPSTEIMTIFPLVMIPAYAVPLGFVLHLFSLWKLKRKKQ